MTDKKHISSKRQDMINAALRPKSPKESSFATAASVAVSEHVKVKVKPKQHLASPQVRFPKGPFDIESEIRTDLIRIYAEDMDLESYTKAERKLIADTALTWVELDGEADIVDNLEQHIGSIRHELIKEELILPPKEKQQQIDDLIRTCLTEHPNAEETIICYAANICKRRGDERSFDDITTHVEARTQHIRKDLEKQGIIQPKSRWNFLMRPF